MPNMMTKLWTVQDVADYLGVPVKTLYQWRCTGYGVREIADQLGHRRVSVTQDTYFGRQDASPRVAAALDVIAEGDGLTSAFPAGKVRPHRSRQHRAGR